MNPIRIASGPPKEEGNYSFSFDDGKTWHSTAVFWYRLTITPQQYLCGQFGSSGIRPVNTAECIWSTRIPDPEEME